MRPRLNQAFSKTLRSTMGAAASKVAGNDKLMSIAYDLMNETNFGGIAEHEEMLSDSVRVGAYHRAIHAAVKPGDVVLDLGTGTGLLAFMAAKAGASKVYAVEHSDFIEVAKELAKANGFTNIEFVQANSREFTPSENVDVVLHEQMGDELFNENMIENLIDLRDRVLAPGGRILPSKFRLYAEPVSMKKEFRVHRIWEMPLPDGLDFRVLQDSAIAEPFMAGRPDQLWLRPGSVEATVGAPGPVLEFDVMTIESPDELVATHRIERTATSDALVDGVAVWFEAVFDGGADGDETILTTSPLAPLTSWGNRMYRAETGVRAGDTMSYFLHMENLVDASTWQVGLESQS